MKACFAIMLAATALALHGAEDPSLLFKADFDRYTVWADYAKGAKNNDPVQGFRSPDLQLRMHRGIPGSKNSVCLTNEESLCYGNYKNFNPQAGTVSFWVSPKNWKPSTKGAFQVFFIGENPDGFKLVMAKWNDGELRFSIQMNNQDVGVIRLPMKDEDWKPDSWHKLDAVWDQTEMRFYVDGILSPTADYYSVFNPLKFKSPRNFPAMQDGANIRFNDARGYAYNKTASTAYDDIRIYDRKLSEAEIQEEYLRVFPADNQPLEPPLAVVPLTAPGSIAVDGTLNEAEWRDATCLPLLSFCAGGQNVLKPQYGNAVLLKHDHQNLYIAAELAGKPNAVGTRRDEEALWRADDALELHFAKGETRYQITINANGVLWDATGAAGQTHIPNGDTAWNPPVEVKTAVGADRWTLEAAIPLKELNLAGAGDTVRANFYRNYYVQGCRLGMAWAEQPQEYFSDEHFGELRLGNDRAFCRVVNHGAPDKGDWNVSMQSSQNMNGHGTLQSLGVSYQTCGNFANAPAWRMQLAGGVWTYALNCFQGGAPFYRLTGRFQYDANLQMSVHGKYKENKIVVRLSFGGLYKTLAELVAAGQVKGLVTMTDAAGTVKRQAEFVPSTPELDVSFPLGEDLPQGVYEIKTTLRGKGIDREETRKFTIPDFTPYRHPLMVDHSVPDPWVPIQTDGKNAYTVLNRTYRFQQGPFPVQITADGLNMLAQPPAFTVRSAAGEETILWSDFKRQAMYDDVAVFTGSGLSRSLKFNWNGELYFDGTWKLDLTAAPRNGKSDLREFALTYSVPREYAQALLTPFYQPLEGKPVALKYNKSLPDFLLWTTGPRHGIAWMPLNSANWYNAPQDSQITLTPDGQNLDIAIRYISAPVTLDKEARYSMLLMATPGKPVAPGLRSFHLGHHTGWGRPCDGENAKCNGHMNDATGYTQSYTTQPWASLRPWKPDKFRAYLDDLAKDGIGYMPYCQPAFLSELEPEYEFFIEDWKLIPGIVGGSAVNYDNGTRYDSVSTCQDAGSADYHMTLLKKCLDDYPDLIGVYYDLCHVVQCGNRNHGHCGIDAFGQEYTTSNVMSLRHFLLRTYKLLHSRGKLQKIHAHHRFVPFCHTFTDFAITGEQYNGKILQDVEHFFTEQIPSGAYRTLYNPEATGMRMLFNSHLELQPTFRPGGTWDLVYVKTPDLTLKFMTPMLLHDIGVVGYYSNRDAIGRYFTLCNECSLQTAEFHGYWESDAVGSRSPKVYVSWYAWQRPSPYERLLVIGNMGRDARPAALQIDWQKLGIAQDGMEFTDVWNRKPIADLNLLQVPGEGFVLVGIRRK